MKDSYISISASRMGTSISTRRCSGRSASSAPSLRPNSAFSFTNARVKVGSAFSNVALFRISSLAEVATSDFLRDTMA
eukprot:6025920-Pleurochrysis_carterae.AAC.5